MSKYAQNTNVSSDKSRLEIERMVAVNRTPCCHAEPWDLDCIVTTIMATQTQTVNIAKATVMLMIIMNAPYAVIR